jgi:hypothetical protein
MEKISNFIDANFNYFSNLEDSEVEIYDLKDFDNEVVYYLILNYRFDYRGICIYYVDETKQIWVENMDA